jgi:hypothetical protein
VDCFLALSRSRREHAAMDFRLFPQKRFSVYRPECKTALAPLPSLRTERLVTPPLLLFGSLAASQLARRSLGFAPPPHDGFAFLAAHGCACRPTSLPTGYKFATVFEVVGVFFRHFLVVRTRKVHRGFIGAG